MRSSRQLRYSLSFLLFLAFAPASGAIEPIELAGPWEAIYGDNDETTHELIFFSSNDQLTGIINETRKRRSAQFVKPTIEDDILTFAFSMDSGYSDKLQLIEKEGKLIGSSQHRYQGRTATPYQFIAKRFEENKSKKGDSLSGNVLRGEWKIGALIREEKSDESPKNLVFSLALDYDDDGLYGDVRPEGKSTENDIENIYLERNTVRFEFDVEHEGQKYRATVQARKRRDRMCGEITLATDFERLKGTIYGLRFIKE